MWGLLYIFKAERYLWTNERKSTIPEKNLTGKVGDILEPPPSFPFGIFHFSTLPLEIPHITKLHPPLKIPQIFLRALESFKAKYSIFPSLRLPLLVCFFWNSPILTINDYSYAYLNITYFRFVAASLATSLAIFLLGLLRMDTTAQIKYLAK